jgi:ferritin-like metal-binding protein YciE
MDTLAELYVDEMKDLYSGCARRRPDLGRATRRALVEHYEMAGYGTVRTFQRTLDEAGDTDKALTKLAETIDVAAENTDE